MALILSDTRQPSSVLKGLEALGYRVIERQLVTGDYVWSVPYGRAGLEVKSLQDLVNSRLNGRLDEQLYRLANSFQLPILLVMGAMDTDLDCPPGWTATALDNLLVGRQMRGIVVARGCVGYEDLPGRLDGLIRYTENISKRPPPRVNLYAFSGALTTRAEVVYNLFRSVRGMKNKASKAEKLVSEYPLSEIVQFSLRDWQKKAGLTKSTAEKIVKFVQGVADE